MGEGDGAGEKKRNRIMLSTVEQERLRNYLCFSEQERDPFDLPEQPRTARAGRPERDASSHPAGEETEHRGVK